MSRYIYKLYLLIMIIISIMVLSNCDSTPKLDPLPQLRFHNTTIFDMTKISVGEVMFADINNTDDCFNGECYGQYTEIEEGTPMIYFTLDINYSKPTSEFWDGFKFERDFTYTIGIVRYGWDIIYSVNTDY